MEEWTTSLLVGETVTGKIFVFTIFLTNLTALCLYFYDTSPSGKSGERET